MRRGLAIAQSSEDNNFEWLADLQKSQCYTTFDLANPSTSTDFGADGYTASLTDWHELLQLTAPDKDCGIVFVRGDFPNNPDAILARAQMRDNTGNKGTFDIHFLNEDTAAGTGRQSQEVLGSQIGDTIYKLGERRAQGIANFRWPYTQYELKLEQRGPYGWNEVRKGSYEGISFVKDGTMFQINRLAPGKPPRNRPGQNQAPVYDSQPIKFRVGNRVQFGCTCSNGAEQSVEDEFEFRYAHRLEIQVFKNGSPVAMMRENNSMTATLLVKISEEEPTIIVSTYTISSNSNQLSDSYPMIPAVKASEMEDYLGISNVSLEMTDKLWLASLTKQFDAIETIEICAVARYVEQILGVSSVPISPSQIFHSPENEKQQPNFETEPGVALIRNIITYQWVSLESTFWQIRFLVKAVLFLESQTFAKSLLEKSEITYLRAMRSSYLHRIETHIRLALLWMTKAQVKENKVLLPIKPEIASTGPNVDSHCGTEQKLKFNTSYDQSCFIAVAVWYVMKHCQHCISSEFRDYLSSIELQSLRLPPSNEDSESRVDKESTPKNDILHWLRTTCLFLIWHELHGESTDNELQGEGERILKSQIHREKIAKRLRKSQSEPYSMVDEEVDRLFLLGEELGFDAFPSGTAFELADARAKETRSRIAKRRRTEVFNSGPRSSNIKRSTVLPSNAPWELACLNHHSLLKTSLDPTKDINQRESRDACFQFILSDYTFMVSWDRADKDMVGKWWDIDAGAVICSTLLDMIGQAKQDSVSRHMTEDLSRSGFLTAPAPRSLEDLVERLVGQLQVRQDVFQHGEGVGTSPRKFDWMNCKPRRYFHLNSWVQSLDDTPAVFQKMKPAFAPQMRGLAKYLTGVSNPHTPEEHTFSRDTVDQNITPQDLEFLSAFDFKLNTDFTIENKMLLLSDAYNPPELPLVTHQKRLLKSLNDSLVDQGTKYRILFAEKCCHKLVSGFSYIWHRDALDTFENYFSPSSHFANKREALLWTTSITLSHWRLLPEGAVVDQNERFFEHSDNAGRIHGIFPPEKVADSGRYLKERSTSLVITGDARGYHWICSIWSPLTDAASIKNIISSLPTVLQLFIHQQGTGRCLVFLILLGHICSKLVKEYNGILEHLDRVAELEDKILFEGLEWDENDPNSTVDKLKRMTWGGQALRILEDRLSASLSEIRNAKETLDHIITHDEGQQDTELSQEYMAVLEGFGKRYNILSNVQVRVQQKIKHIIGLRDGISDVNFLVDSRHALRDSKTTIKQGNNIRVLTLITILFLPLSYVTGLFSENHEVLPSNAGKGLYAGLVVLLTVLTYGLAFLLQWDKLTEFWNGSKVTSSMETLRPREYGIREEREVLRGGRGGADFLDGEKDAVEGEEEEGDKGWCMRWRKREKRLESPPMLPL